MRTLFLFFTVVFLFNANVFSQNQTLYRGMVAENTVTTDSISVNYAIYLPDTYDPSKPVKSLFVFDPNGEGVRAARLFVSALVNQDYAIIANNSPMSSSLDSLDANANIAIKIMRDVFTKVSLDKNLIYMTGLGAGAKTASAVSYVLRNPTGLLLIDDVYYADEYLSQAKGNSVIGLVGESSPNYYQMSDYFQMMKVLNGYNEIYTYKDSGEWPQASFLGVLMNRLNHFQSERFKREISDSTWQQNYEKDLIGLQGIVTDKNYLTAYDLAVDLKKEYRGNVDLDALKDFYRSLRKTDAYKATKRSNRSGSLEELLLIDDMSYFLDEDLAVANFENLGYWDSRIREFNASALNTNKPNEQKVAKRTLGYINYMIEDFLALNGKGLLPQRIFANVLKTMLEPKNYQAYLNIIDLSAQDKDDNTAYFYLEELLKQGYTDYESLYEIPNTTLLRIKPVYNQIVEKYLGRSKF